MCATVLDELSRVNISRQIGPDNSSLLVMLMSSEGTQEVRCGGTIGIQWLIHVFSIKSERAAAWT